MIDLTTDIIAETENWVAVRKPHGLHVLPDRYDRSIPTVTDILSERFGRLFIVHRLDSGTGGVLLLAKNAAAHRYFNTVMEEGRAEKTYLAIVKGVFPYPVSIMLPIAAKNQKGRYRINFKSGRSARTSFSPLGCCGGASLVAAKLHTGRTHQIRVHLRAHGHPLVSDWLYGDKSEDRRLSLFANNMNFIDMDGARVILNAELSSYMTDALKKIGINKDTACKIREVVL
ncbi:RNA pseudouridine synthase [Geovibrio thiophilus]|uniref:RNA pseudouridine synthase n=1 Tax=Geovibrio thiophilus TaxID=139438 RepID=A0A3R6AZL6_9BACT|nr:RNA pseudouridine synthase [Geovibrio thiophilus]QAR34177.1 RNA pseudouridine synthase [Geovibrio thiophilus]